LTLLRSKLGLLWIVLTVLRRELGLLRLVLVDLRRYPEQLRWPYLIELAPNAS